MKELIYFYLIVGCYIAYRKTSNLDVNAVDFLKTYLKIVVTYPKELLAKKRNKSEEGNL